MGSITFNRSHVRFSNWKWIRSILIILFHALAGVSNTGFYNWDPIRISFDLSNGHAFFVMLYNNTPGTNSILFGSHYFNLTDGTSASSKTSSSSPTSTTTSSSSSSSSTTSTTSTTASSAPAVVSTVTAAVTPSASASSTSGSTGLTAGAKTGLGASLGVGIPVLAVIVVSLFVLGKKNRKAKQNTPAYGGQGNEYQQKPPLGTDYGHNPAPIHELP